MAGCVLLSPSLAQPRNFGGLRKKSAYTYLTEVCSSFYSFDILHFDVNPSECYIGKKDKNNNKKAQGFQISHFFLTGRHKYSVHAYTAVKGLMCVSRAHVRVGV